MNAVNSVDHALARESMGGVPQNTADNRKMDVRFDLGSAPSPRHVF